MSVTSWIRRQFNNAVSVTDYIPGGMSNVATSFVAHDGTTFPDGSVGDFIVTVDQGLATEERILCSSRSGPTFNVATNGRGYNGYTAQNHGSNATLLHTMDKQDLDEANQVAVQTLGAVQAAGDLLVGSAANTLTRLAKGSTTQFLQAGNSTLQWVSFGVGQSKTIAVSNTDGTNATPARSDHTHMGVASVNGSTGAVTVVGSLNGRNGAVTLASADVTNLFTAAGNLYVGTGSNTGEQLAVGAAGTVLSVGGSDPSGLEWIYPALTNASGHLGGDYSPTGSLATFLTTASLAAGTWLVTFGTSVTPGTSAGVEIQVAAGTATSTFEGKLSMELSATSTSTQFLEGTMSVIATVTAPGTLVFQAKRTGVASLIKATTPSSGLANATGYTAVRIA